MKKGQLEKQIRAVLELDTASRNSDIRLMQVIWYKFYNHLLFKSFDGEQSIRIKDLYNLPREDYISRIRRKIQNDEHLYVPTSREVAEQRGFKNVEEWRSYLGYNNTNDTL